MVSFPSCSTVCPAGFLPKFSVKWRKFSLEAEPRGEILGTKTENEGWKPAGQTVEHDGKQTKPLSEKDQVRKVQIVKYMNIIFCHLPGFFNRIIRIVLISITYQPELQNLRFLSKALPVGK